MPAFPELPIGRCGIATLYELLAAGWTYEAVRHALRTGRLERVAAGRYAVAVPEHLDRFAQADLRLLRRAVAATLPGDRAAVSHLAAALHRRLPVWAETPRPCVSTWEAGLKRVAGLHVHHLPDTDSLVRRGGVPVTSTARTIVDIAREFGTESALVSGDRALREGLLTLPTLAAEVVRAAGWPGVEHARHLADLLDPLAESPLESRGRWKFHLHGIDQPLSQVWIYTVTGRFLGRVDHFWPEGVVGEADGTLKYENDRQALVKEKTRQQGLEDVDLQMARWGSRDMVDFTAAAGRIERARVRARRLLATGSVPQWYALDRTGSRVPVPGVDGS